MLGNARHSNAEEFTAEPHQSTFSPHRSYWSYRVAAFVLVLLLVMFCPANIAHLTYGTSRSPSRRESLPTKFSRRGWFESQLGTGPTSTGWGWRQKVVNIDIRQRTYSLTGRSLTATSLNILFTAFAMSFVLSDSAAPVGRVDLHLRSVLVRRCRARCWQRRGRRCGWSVPKNLETASTVGSIEADTSGARNPARFPSQKQLRSTSVGDVFVELFDPLRGLSEFHETLNVQSSAPISNQVPQQTQLGQAHV